MLEDFFTKSEKALVLKWILSSNLQDQYIWYCSWSVVDGIIYIPYWQHRHDQPNLYSGGRASTRQCATNKIIFEQGQNSFSCWQNWKIQQLQKTSAPSVFDRTFEVDLLVCPWLLQEITALVKERSSIDEVSRPGPEKDWQLPWCYDSNWDAKVCKDSQISCS